jgi:hypothetical protein
VEGIPVPGHDERHRHRLPAPHGGSPGRGVGMSRPPFPATPR